MDKTGTEAVKLYGQALKVVSKRNCQNEEFAQVVKHIGYAKDFVTLYTK